MTKMLLSIASILVGVAVLLVGAVAPQLPLPDSLTVESRSLGTLPSNVSLAFAIGGIVAVLCSLILGSANPRAVATLRYLGVVAVLIGVFVDGFRVPFNIQAHFTELSPVPSGLTVALMVAGGFLVTLCVVALAKAAQPGHSTRARRR